MVVWIARAEERAMPLALLGASTIARVVLYIELGMQLAPHSTQDPRVHRFRLNNKFVAIGVSAICIILLATGALKVIPGKGETSSGQQTPPNLPSTQEAQPRTQPPADLSFVQQDIVTATGDGSFTLRVAQPFRLTVAAEGLGKARFMAWSPDGRLFVPDMVNMNLSHEGKLYVLEDFDPQTKRFRKTSVYLSHLRRPHSVAFYTDPEGKHWLYLALTAHLVRYPYEPGSDKPSGEPEIIATFPNTQEPKQTSVVWHITRTITFRNGRLYVSVGSGCNACEQVVEPLRAMIASMRPDGSDFRVHARGLRNAVGFTFDDTNTLYTTENGVDHLGPDAPDDVMYRITDGAHYGWPYCYEKDAEVFADHSFPWSKPFACEQVPRSFASFGPHAAPLGIAYFPTDAHPTLRDSFLVALHGSFDPSLAQGYTIVRVRRDNGTVEPFIEGFLRKDPSTQKTERFGRPVAFLPDGLDAFFFTDDFTGRLYYVYARQEAAPNSIGR